ncbi:MAG: NADH-quinone oxidoreductase subunit F [Ignavibacteriales bacterium]|nr:NADH-quinone oxidoreductase subunit F [Ignavibacteriales bacterium]
MKTAIVIGATGLVGKFLLQNLLVDERYSSVKIFTRKSLGITSPKLSEHIVDFEKLHDWKNEITGDELYSAMGTTIKKAGSKAVQYKIDFSYQYESALAAFQNGVEKYLLVSSAGANENSGNFYLKMKGELDRKVSSLGFKNILIFRPSILAGERNEKRTAEKYSIAAMNILSMIIPPLKKYKPVEAETIAKFMINKANESLTKSQIIFELNQISV